MAKKLESTLPNMVLSLVLISMVMSASLAFVYLKTKDPISEAARQKELDAILRVSPSFDNDPASSRSDSNGISLFRLTKEGEPVGFAVKSFTEQGFSGHIEIMAGFTSTGEINKVAVLQQKETPGLGTKMSDPSFSTQFEGKNPSRFRLSVRKDGGDVDAITAATISSRAYCDALQRAYDFAFAGNDSNLLIKETP